MSADVERFRRLLARMPEVAPRLRRCSGVHRVDVGFRYVDGVRTSKLAVRVFIVGKKVSRRRSKTMNLAPAHCLGVPVDVVRFIPRSHVGRGGATSPSVEGGLRIGSRSGDFVTLGAVLTSHTYPGLVAVTSDEIGDAGNAVYSPEPGAPGSRQIGVATPPSRHNAAALVSLSVQGVRDALLGLPPLCAIPGQTELDELCANATKVFKVGAGTGTTHGVFDGKEDESGTVTISSDGSGILCDNGDCGSIWATADGKAIGLHYGGSEGRALAQAFHCVRDALAIVF